MKNMSKVIVLTVALAVAAGTFGYSSPAVAGTGKPTITKHTPIKAVKYKKPRIKRVKHHVAHDCVRAPCR